METKKQKDANRRGTSFTREEINLIVELFQHGEPDFTPNEVWNLAFNKFKRMAASF